jgi:hypothetical protein
MSKNHESDERNASFQKYEGEVQTKVWKVTNSTSSWREHKELENVD